MMKPQKAKISALWLIMGSSSFFCQKSLRKVYKSFFGNITQLSKINVYFSSENGRVFVCEIEKVYFSGMPFGIFMDDLKKSVCIFRKFGGVLK